MLSFTIIVTYLLFYKNGKKLNGKIMVVSKSWQLFTLSCPNTLWFLSSTESFLRHELFTFL